MTDSLAIALAQINPTVGDVGGNVARLLAARTEAAKAGADLVVASELVVAGYPPEDLVLKRAFQDAVEKGVEKMALATNDGGPALLVGAPWRNGSKLYNAALLLDAGGVATVRFKHDLPNYGVFDEKRLFAAGPLPGPVSFRGARLGVMVCEDMWTPDVAECLQESGAEILVVINGSPFETDKHEDRLNLAVARVVESGLPLIYVNQVGGQDELVFDGASFVLGQDKRFLAKARSWREKGAAAPGARADGGWGAEAAEIASEPEMPAAVYQALVLGLRDYVGKNGFPGLLIGLSGGIDSALTAAVAVDALGADKVHGVIMPSPYTSRESIEDATDVAKRLGIRVDTISIEPAMKTFGAMLKDVFAGRAADETEENIQARARGVTLMALSNKFGFMVLSTGNKSEMSVGYTTLYGDMCGGYSVLKDIYKTEVYALARWRNKQAPEGGLGPAGRVIPESSLTKAPTAELRPDQTDQDSLPPYDSLDAILNGLIEEEQSVDEIVARGFARETVTRVQRLLYTAEYKRRQAPPGVKITRKSFGRDRRYPLTNAFREP